MKIEITVPVNRMFDYDGVEELLCDMRYGEEEPFPLLYRCNALHAMNEITARLAPGSKIEEFRIWEGW